MAVRIVGLENNNKIIGKIPHDAEGRVVFSGRDAILVIGKNVKLKNISFLIKNNAIVFIGDDCEVHGQIRCNGKSTVYIGARTKVLGASRLHASEQVDIRIGEDCVLKSLRCRTSDSHYIFSASTQDRINLGLSIEIGDRVYFGEGVFVLKGVSVGHNSYVLDHTVLVKNIPPHTYVYGNPMQMRTNIEWTTRL
jgi:acetyltransferase-like isoleucine patch superfamily enzyme